MITIPDGHLRELAAGALVVGLPVLHALARRLGRRRRLAKFKAVVEAAAAGNAWVEAAGVTAIECRLSVRRGRASLVFDVTSPKGTVTIDCTRFTATETAAYVGIAAMALLDAGTDETPHGPGSGGAATLPRWCMVLGLPPDAGRKDILDAWRRLSKTAHPDVGGSEERMKEVNAAKEAALEGQA